MNYSCPGRPGKCRVWGEKPRSSGAGLLLCLPGDVPWVLHFAWYFVANADILQSEHKLSSGVTNTCKQSEGLWSALSFHPHTSVHGVRLLSVSVKNPRFHNIRKWLPDRSQSSSEFYFQVEADPFHGAHPCCSPLPTGEAFCHRPRSQCS